MDDGSRMQWPRELTPDERRAQRFLEIDRIADIARSTVALYPTVRDVNAAIGDGQRILRNQGWLLLKRVKLKRNEACPCRSGRKAKDCHLGKALLVAPLRGVEQVGNCQAEPG